jgi:hypothetical protein
MRSKAALTAGIAALLVGAGVASAVALAAKPSPGRTKAVLKKAATTTGTSTTTTGAFQSNEDATHETNETAAHEAAENSGQFHGGHDHGNGASNENAAHETGESAAREAQEDAAKTTTTP